MRTAIAAILALLTCLAADELPKLPTETMGLIDQARSLSPEFSADTLLRLATSSAIPEPRWKRQLIEEAFTSGAHAQLPYPQRGEDTADARSSRAFWKNELEALTLQTRAVQAMLALDPQRARAMFEDIPTPQVPALKCTETGAPDLSSYYQTAADVLARGFSAEQRGKLRHLQFLKRLIGLMQSPAHVTPAVKLIFTAQVTPEERQELVADFAGALDVINGTPRVYGAVTWQLVPVSAPVKLPPGVRGASPMLASPAGDLPSSVVAAAPLLLPALRSYIVRHESGPRCTETIRAGTLPQAVNDFNHLVARLDPTAAAYQPVSEREVKPAKDDGAFEPHNWWQSKRSKQVLDALKWLNHGNRDLPGDKRFFMIEERMSTDWNAHFFDTLKLIEGWNEQEEDSAEDWFGMVSESYELLAEKAPPDKRREAAMGRYVSFMETHYAAVENHNFWFTQWHNLWRSKDPWVVGQLSHSANPVIALYARINRFLTQ